MKVKLVAATLVLWAGSMGAVFAADQPGADWITIDKVRQILTDAGYTQITELEADDGHWEGEGMKNGKMMDFHIDPRTGKFTKEELDR